MAQVVMYHAVVFNILVLFLRHTNPKVVYIKRYFLLTLVFSSSVIVKIAEYSK